jgi:hypothetical protein
MAKSKALSPAEYLAELPADRRATLKKVRAVIRRHLPKGYRETINWGVISYEVPLSRFPNTYNGQPLMYAGLAAQKNYHAVYLTAAYADPAKARWLARAFKAQGKKLDIGKSCIRFWDADDLALDAIGEVIASTSVADFVAAFRKTPGKIKPKREARRAHDQPSPGSPRQSPRRMRAGSVRLARRAGR